jgi:hypothetical protein
MKSRKVKLETKIKTLKKLLSKTTPGPWKFYDNEYDEPFPVIEYRNNGKDDHEGDYGGFELLGGTWINEEHGQMEIRLKADAAFIAAARTWTKDLIEELERLRGEDETKKQGTEKVQKQTLRKRV